MQKPKLILGTANFGPKPYGLLKEPLSLVDIRFILEYAKKHGITILEGSELYDCDGILRDLSFNLIYKVKHPYNLDEVLIRTGRDKLMGLMYHHGEDTKSQKLLSDSRVLYRGASVYSRRQLSGNEDMVEVPLNVGNKDFETFEAPCKLVRSVFGRGELLQQGKSVKECLDYVKRLSNVHGVVVGVNSVQELKEVIEAWQ